jgi:copper resistance protein B
MRTAWLQTILRLSIGGCAAYSAVVPAQTVPDQNAAAPFGAPLDDQRVYLHAQLDQFEMRAGGAAPSFRWDGEAWAGTDTNRLVIKSEGIVADGTTQEGEHELLYDRPLSSYFDLQAGLRYDLDALPSRGWAAFGVEGLAPYFVKIAATAYASDAGHWAAKVTASWEASLTQRLIIEPQVELNAYSRPDAARDVAAGVSDIDAGVRLRYEVRRKFAPYAGVAYERRLGPAARINAVRAAAGLRVWL